MATTGVYGIPYLEMNDEPNLPEVTEGIAEKVEEELIRIDGDLDAVEEDVATLLAGVPNWQTLGGTIWTGSLGNPSVGNGTVACRWRYIDSEQVEVRYIVRPGSTTSFGSGNYRLALPVAAVSGGPHPLLQGAALLGSSLYRFVGWVNTASSSATEVTVYRDNLTSEALSGWTPTAPTTFANGHSFAMYGTYFVA